MCAQGARRLSHIHDPSPFVFLTICTWKRRRLLTADQFGPVTRDQLLRSAGHLASEISAYTVMPNHVHVLLRATGITLCCFVHHWKQATGYKWRRLGNRQPLWQRGFYDRVLRFNEDPRRLAHYIVMNPVRAGLVARPGDHDLSHCAL